MDFTKIKKYPSQISNVVKRFPLSLGFAAFATLYLIFLERTSHSSLSFMELHPRRAFWIALFSILSIFLTTTTKLLEEVQGYSPKRSRIISGTALGVLFALTAWLMATADPDSGYKMAQIVVTSAIVILSPLFVPFFKSKDDISQWNFMGKTVISLIVSFIICLIFDGAVSGLFACSQILLNVDFNEYFYIDLAIICSCLVFPTLFLAGLPNLKEPITNREIHKLIHNTLHFLFMPVLLFYLFFIYAFIIKQNTVEIFDEPTIWILCLTAIVGTVLIGNIIYPANFNNYGIDKKFLKIIPWFSIPLVFYALHLLVSLLGETHSDRFALLYVISFFLWLLGACIILLVPKIKRKIWWSITSLCLVAIVTTFSPLNVFRLSAYDYPRNQKHLEWEQELQEKEAQRIEELRQEEAKIKRYRFDFYEDTVITIPANRSAFRKFYSSIDKENISLVNDTIYFKANANPKDTTFLDFAVAISKFETEKEPSYLVIDNESHTLVLKSARFNVTEDGKGDYGFVEGFLFQR